MTSLKSKLQGRTGSRGSANFEGGSKNKHKDVTGSSSGRGKRNLDHFVRYWNSLEGKGMGVFSWTSLKEGETI